MGITKIIKNNRNNKSIPATVPVENFPPLTDANPQNTKPAADCDEKPLTTPHSYVVIDDENIAGRVILPAKKVFRTAGKKAYDSFVADHGEGEAAWCLCLDFLAHACHLGRDCHKIHASPKFIKERRIAELNCALCCTSCDRHHEPEMHSGKRIVVRITDSYQRELPIHLLAWTRALQESFEQFPGWQTLNIHGTRICRLHQNGKCSYGPECNYFHICREVFDKYFRPLPDYDTSLYPKKMKRDSSQTAPTSVEDRTWTTDEAPVDSNLNSSVSTCNSSFSCGLESRGSSPSATPGPSPPDTPRSGCDAAEQASVLTALAKFRTGMCGLHGSSAPQYNSYRFPMQSQTGIALLN
eukprot:TRINITY_DN16810_c0_g1_i1.p1 TRINITY_DN16810_c0_g1~~TRINITY_DN16810_c0_g1_i1.p1  ORF type:complete len:354 (-),score=26.16 TRINITY_DN16810_c0_g1_i1:657-1718(-)